VGRTLPSELFDLLDRRPAWQADEACAEHLGPAITHPSHGGFGRMICAKGRPQLADDGVYGLPQRPWVGVRESGIVKID
jgi:hypothetical protein